MAMLKIYDQILLHHLPLPDDLATGTSRLSRLLQADCGRLRGEARFSFDHI